MCAAGCSSLTTVSECDVIDSHESDDAFFVGSLSFDDGAHFCNFVAVSHGDRDLLLIGRVYLLAPSSEYMDLIASELGRDLHSMYWGPIVGLSKVSENGYWSFVTTAADSAVSFSLEGNGDEIAWKANFPGFSHSGSGHFFGITTDKGKDWAIQFFRSKWFDPGVESLLRQLGR
jgi:hypothetical protein